MFPIRSSFHPDPFLFVLRSYHICFILRSVVGYTFRFSFLSSFSVLFRCYSDMFRTFPVRSVPLHYDTFRFRSLPFEYNPLRSDAFRSDLLANCCDPFRSNILPFKSVQLRFDSFQFFHIPVFSVPMRFQSVPLQYFRDQ